MEGSSASRDRASPPTHFEAFEKLLIGRFPDLTAQQQKIGRFVLDHPSEAALDTVAVLAGRVEVQPSALVRFAQSLGYEGFGPLQAVFRSRLLLEFNSYRERVETLGGIPAAGTSVLDNFVDEAIASLELLRRSVPEDKLAAAAKQLAAARHVYVLAQGRPVPIGFYLVFALTRLRKRCTLLDNAGGIMRQQLDLATPDDVLVALSFRPYTQLVIDLAAEQAASGVPTIAITDSPLSPLARVAGLTLEIRDKGQQVFQSLNAALCLAQALAVALGQQLAQGDSRRTGSDRRGDAHD